MFSRFARKTKFLNLPQFFCFSSRNVQNSTDVQLRGTFIKGNYEDLPTMVVLPEMFEQSSNLRHFISDPKHKILNERNVWLLDYRNFGNSDRHASMDMEDVTADISRWIEEQKLTMVTMMGHGYGAKVALAFGARYYEQCTGVICLSGGPFDHRQYPAFHKLTDWILEASQLELKGRSRAEIEADLAQIIDDPKWLSVFCQNVHGHKTEGYRWFCGMDHIVRAVKKHHTSNPGHWSARNGIWPGKALFMFGEYTPWVHVASNTNAIYDACPLLEKKFGADIKMIQGPADDSSHWIYETPAEQVTSVGKNIAKFLRMKDGVHQLLENREELNDVFITERGQRPGRGTEVAPEHFHHNWKHTDEYETAKLHRKN